MSKTVEELMRPRYIVENLWPDSPYQVGEILVPDFEDRDKWVVEGYGLISPVLNDNPNKWPHLFRKLEWWEERIFVDPGFSGKYVKEFDVMPQFIRSRSTGNIYKVIWYSVDGFEEVNCLVETENGSKFRALTDMDISSESEYKDFIKSKEQTNG